MEADLPFFAHHQTVLDAVGGRDHNLPPIYNADWDAYLLRVDKAVQGADPSRYHLVNSAELMSLVPRMWKAVHGMLPDNQPYIYENLRTKKYYVSRGSLHPLRETVKTVQLFSLVSRSK